MRFAYVFKVLSVISHRTITQPNNRAQQSPVRPPTIADLQWHLATRNNYFKWHKAANQKDDYSSLLMTLTEDGQIGAKPWRPRTFKEPVSKKTLLHSNFTNRAMISLVLIFHKVNMRDVFKKVKLVLAHVGYICSPPSLNIRGVLSPQRIRHFLKFSSFAVPLF